MAEALRNLGIVAHVDAGKTTLSEQLLLLGGAIRQAGRVDEGLATMDYLREEQRRGITIRAGLASFPWKGARINFIDTPGHMDFGLEVERALRVLDAAIVVLCGVRGVEPRTRAIWSLCDRYDIPRLAWVNKLDMPGADFAGIVLELEESFGISAVPVDWPVFHQGSFLGSVDLATRRTTLWKDGQPVRLPEVPEAWKGEVEPARERMLDQASRFDDDLTRALLEGLEPSPALIRKALRRGVAQRALLPVCGGSALRGWNVDALLDQSVLLSPPPVPPAGLKDHPGLGFVFKKTHDPGNPPVCLARMIAGKMQAGDWVRKAGTAERCVVRAMHTVFADRLDPTLEVEAGDFAALELDGAWKAGDTFVVADGPDHVIRFETSLSTVLEMAIETRDEDTTNRVGPILSRWADEEGAIEVEQEPGTGRWLVRGQGELQLDVIASRLREEIGDVFRVGAAQVRHRERLLHGIAPQRQITTWEGRRIELEIEAEPAPGFAVSWKGDAREGVRAACEASLRRCATDGVMGGGHLEGVHWGLEVVEDQDVPPWVAKQLLDHCAPLLLVAAGVVRESPQVRIHIHTPMDYVGAVTTELQTRGATIQGIDTQRNGAIISALSPLERVLGCAKLLLSLSKGQANTTLVPGGWVAESA